LGVLVFWWGFCFGWWSLGFFGGGGFFGDVCVGGLCGVGVVFVQADIAGARMCGMACIVSVFRGVLGFIDVLRKK